METQQLRHPMAADGLIEARARLEPTRNAQPFETDSQSAASILLRANGFWPGSGYIECVPIYAVSRRAPSCSCTSNNAAR